MRTEAQAYQLLVDDIVSNLVRKANRIEDAEELSAEDEIELSALDLLIERMSEISAD